MKKVFAILLVLALVAGFVFADTTNSPDAQGADGTAKIVVTADIDEEVPVFQLRTDDTDNVESAVGDTESTPDPSTAIKDTLAQGLADGTDVTVDFSINQVANANLKASYSIKVTATDLLLTKYSDNTAFSGTQNDVQKFICSTKTPAVSAPENPITATVGTTSVNAITFTGTSGNVLKVQYTGLAKVAAEDADTKRVSLGTFSVTWDGNDSAVAGHYEADVQIEVTSV